MTVPSALRPESVEPAIRAFGQGRMVIIVDDPGREGEGDLALPADAVTPEAINFMASQGRGLICVALEPSRCDRLKLTPMVQHNTAPFGTNFTVSVDPAGGTTTGVSARDRAVTVRALLDDRTRPQDLVRPGHVFPLRYREGGILARPGHTEASVDLCRIAVRYPAAVF